MIPAPLDLVAYRGDTYVKPIRLKYKVAGTYIDLTGCTATAQVRMFPDSSILATITVTVNDQTTTPGAVTLELSPTATAALDADLRAFWDLEVTSGDGSVNTYVAGRFTVRGDYTH